jgi:hypothetical protein
MAGTAPRQKDSPTGAGISGKYTYRDIKPAFLQPFYHLFLSSMPPLATAEPHTTLPTLPALKLSVPVPW